MRIESEKWGWEMRMRMRSEKDKWEWQMRMANEDRVMN